MAINFPSFFPQPQNQLPFTQELVQRVLYVQDQQAQQTAITGAQTSLNNFDTNMDTQIQFQEILDTINPFILNQSTIRQLAMFFIALDANTDGSLNIAELAANNLQMDTDMDGMYSQQEQQANGSLAQSSPARFRENLSGIIQLAGLQSLVTTI